MTWFPKRLFEWKEPEEFRTQERRKAKEAGKWWHALVAIGIVDLNMVLFVWAPAHWVPGRHPAPLAFVLLMGAVLGMFLVYGVPWMSNLGPSTVFIIEGFVVRQRAQLIRVSFKDIDAFSWRQAPQYSILVLHYRKGFEKHFGVPLSFNQGDLTAFLLSSALSQRK